MQTPARAVLCLAFLLLAACVSPLQRDLDTILQPPELQGVRWGLLVTDMQGREIAALNPDQRFLPASNTKLFTTAAVHRWQDDLALMAPRLATHVTLEDSGEDAAEPAPPTLVLHGRGDPALSDAPGCETSCLAHLADAVAASGLTHITRVIGDDTWFPHDRWPHGWSWEDLQSDDGTAVSALTLNDNALTLSVAPAATEGEPAIVAWADGSAAYAILNETVTAEAEADDFLIARPPGADTVRVSGHVPPGSPARAYRLGVDNPAELAARRFSALLAARGLTIDAPAAAQDWGDDWRATFPVGGRDGSLRRRFRGTLLEGRIAAKTGTLKGTNALSGYLTTASGQTLVFAMIANDRPLSVPSAIPFMDAALVRIAEGN